MDIVFGNTWLENPLPRAGLDDRRLDATKPSIPDRPEEARSVVADIAKVSRCHTNSFGSPFEWREHIVATVGSAQRQSGSTEGRSDIASKNFAGDMRPRIWFNDVDH